MSNASINVYQSDPALRESLASEVIPDPMQGEQTWPTEHDLDSVISGNLCLICINCFANIFYVSF